ncbi:ABC-type uncharacterized transport system [[Leptolyngbya] sp. PCC 7376]|uniref:GldG family protein n=1 Tax=[Leptolyngbya] sp. PCC 7376 TaxID=111781 RepID=UPI00029EF288|nr:Gldg family protein [[Leptolyngbya] sp. PCC 7376]AFY38070.1 ABC-type uncharacterized transport system [[Leptolyngbya] sp. PCC 7376]
MGNWSLYLIWCGTAIAIAGLVVLTAVQGNILLAYGLIMVGLTLLICGVAGRKQTQTWLMTFWSRRSVQLGTNGFLSAIAMLFIWLSINGIAAQFPLRFDLTETQVNSLSSQTRQTIQTLKEPLKIWLFQEVDDAEVTPFLENYRRINSRIQYQFVDPDIDVRLIRRFNVQNRGEVHLEYGEKTQFVQTLAAEESLTEAKLTNAILRITSDRQPQLYILQGHGEPPLDDSQKGLVQMVKALEAQGYRVNALNLIQTPNIPADGDIIAIIAPQTALLPGEVELLQEFLDQQKSLLFLLDPNTDPNLDSILEQWGIGLDQRILIDGDRRSEQLGYGNTAIITTRYGTHPITKSLDDDISLYQFVRPIAVKPTAGIKANSFLLSDELTWAESQLPSPDATFDPATDLRGPVDFGIALESQYREDLELPKARVVVIGNTSLATNNGFSQYANGDILLNVMNWLDQNRDVSLAIRPRSPENRRLQLTTAQVNLIAWLGPVIFPLGGLITGLILFKKRR